MEMLRIFSGEINWVISVSLFAFSLVDDLSSVSVENGPFALSFSESLFESFAETINVRSVDLGSDLHVMFWENKGFVVGGENGGSIDFPNDSEIEWIWGVFEADSTEVDWVGELGQGIDGPRITLGNFVPVVVKISNLDVEIIKRVYIEDELKILVNWTGGFQVVVIRSSVLEGKSNPGESFVNIDNSVVRFCVDQDKQD